MSTARKQRTAARHGRLRKHSGIRSFGRVLGAMVAVVAVSSVSVVAIAAWDVASSAAPSVDLSPGASGTPVPEIDAIEGGVNILLAGSDSAQGSAEGEFGERGENLNDVTMLMHISDDHSNVEIISFPRDLFVPIPSCTDPETGEVSSAMSSQKINTSLSYGGLACTVATVRELTGLDIPYGALIQFNGVIEMSNAVGGVDVCVATKLEDEYTGLDLEPGTHTLVGAEALAFLRTRHGVGDGSDLTRISSQQVFLSSLVRKIKSAGTLSNPVALYGLAKAAVSNIALSDGLNDPANLASIGFALKDVNLADVAFIQYPTVTVDGGVEPNEEAATALFDQVRADQPVAVAIDTEDGGSTIDPNAPVSTDAATPAPTDGATPDPTATDGSTDGSTPGTTQQGQTAADYTCSVGRTLEDQ